MTPTFVIFVVYFTLGLLTAIVMDKEEMQKHVPYGNMPAIVTLKQIRIVLYLFCLLFGFWVLLAGFTQIIIETIKSKIKTRRAIRNINKIAKQHKEIADVWYPILERIKKGERIKLEVNIHTDNTLTKPNVKITEEHHAEQQ